MEKLIIYTPASFKSVLSRQGLTKADKETSAREHSSRHADREAGKRRRAELERKIPDRPQHFDKMTLLKIDEKTSIYIERGADPEAARRKFFKTNPEYVLKTEKFR